MTLNRALTAVLFMVVLAALTAGVSYAQTPDGQTPAEETVCDLESGAAFGLCNAYCEAMDCHLPDPEHPFAYPNASQTACGRVRDNFIKFTGRDLPCICPDGEKGCFCAASDPACANGLSCDPSTNTCVMDECTDGTLDCPCREDEPECDTGFVCQFEPEPAVCVPGGQA